MKTKHYISIVALCLGLVVLIAMNCVAIYFRTWLTAFFGGRGYTFDGDDVLQSRSLADELCEDIEEEGIILLKNENGTLPLNDVTDVNVFGWGATDAGFVMSGSGSGSAMERGGVVTPTYFLGGLKQAGFNYNEELIAAYESFKSKKDGNQQSLYSQPSEFFRLYEPGSSFYTDELMSRAKKYSDTAIVVISRLGGEGPDLPYVQYKYVEGGSPVIDNTRTYLELSTEEEDMLRAVSKANFSRVIVVLNTCNVMELGFLNNFGIGAAISVGGPGQSGCKAIGNVLCGKVNPSGKTTDTYAYEFESAPSYVNAPTKDLKNYTNTNPSSTESQYIDYAEDIYVGYKWYETAEAEDFWFYNGTDYDSVVQYPFGFGLSYTTFKWEVEEVYPHSGSELKKDDKIEIYVKVTNTGNVAGRDVVELYYTPYYEKGGIEKSAVNLCAFAKTDLLQPKEHQVVKLSFDVEDMKSYDCYDKNNNGFCGYELEAGPYSVSLRTDAHNIANCKNSVVEYIVNEDIRYENDTVTGTKVENLFTGATAYSGVSIDGNTIDGKASGANIQYLSREDFKTTYPKTTAARKKHEKLISMGNHWFEQNDVTSMPTQGSTETNLSLTVKNENGTTEYNKDLVLELGNSKTGYDSALWESLLNQITVQELINLVEYGGFKTYAVPSVGKPECIDLDGPSGLNSTVASQASASWTCYPVEIVIAATWSVEIAYSFGVSVGNEAAATKVSGWYAPVANLHRSPFAGRNFECYSEDSFLSGQMCAKTVYGAMTKGVYCYIKHFVAYENQTTPAGVYSWMTEQAFRETYLKPFEIAVKDGGANGVMSSFNRVGAHWVGGNKAILQTVLREEWGFRGTVVTDWSSGGDYMNVDQGLCAGNDLWLTGEQTRPSGHTDKTSAAAVSNMRTAAKNILYTYCNTYYVASNAGNEVAVKEAKNVFPVWIWILVAIDVVFIAGLTVGAVFTVKSIKRAKEQEV